MPSHPGVSAAARRSISASSKPGTLPRHPHDAPAVARVELVEPGPAVGAGRERDRPVRMQVIDVRRGQERVERRVDRRRHAARTERAHRVQVHHLVFVRLAAVAIDQLLELVEIEQRESRARDRSQIAAAALHRQHACGLSGERIRQVDLRAGVPAAEVRDAQVRAEHVAPVPEQLERIGLERRRLARVPQVRQKRNVTVSRPRRLKSPGDQCRHAARHSVDTGRSATVGRPALRCVTPGSCGAGRAPRPTPRSAVARTGPAGTTGR